jgi:hypothetical protein
MPRGIVEPICGFLAAVGRSRTSSVGRSRNFSPALVRITTGFASSAWIDEASRRVCQEHQGATALRKRDAKQRSPLPVATATHLVGAGLNLKLQRQSFAFASSSASVRTRQCGICNAVRLGNLSAERFEDLRATGPSIRGRSGGSFSPKTRSGYMDKHISRVSAAQR